VDLWLYIRLGLLLAGDGEPDRRFRLFFLLSWHPSGAMAARPPRSFPSLTLRCPCSLHRRPSRYRTVVMSQSMSNGLFASGTPTFSSIRPTDHVFSQKTHRPWSNAHDGSLQQQLLRAKCAGIVFNPFTSIIMPTKEIPMTAEKGWIASCI
jgi:hypothetical protein